VLVLALAATLPGVRSDLLAAKRSLSAAQDDLQRGDLHAARRELAAAGRRSAHADTRTHGLVWRVTGHVPVARGPVHELQAMSAALRVTTSSVVPPLLELTDQPHWTGRVDPSPFRRLHGPLERSTTVLEATRRRLRAAPHSHLSALSTPRRQLDDALTRLASSLNEARVAAAAVPDLVSGNKRYLLAVQNNAEPRATGGLIGAYALLDVRGGALHLTRVGPDNDLRDSARPVVQLGTEYDDRYRSFRTTSVWRSANLSPDAPTAGRILLGLWRQQFGEQLDGAVLVDPVALADLLGATGPVTLSDGTRITAQNAVRVLLVDAYLKFPRKQDAERNAYLQEAARRVVQRLTSPGLRGERVLRQVAAAAGSGHLQVVAAAPAVEAQLVQARFGGALRADGPYLSVVTQDAGGSKLGAYLRRAVRYDGRPTGEATDLGHGPELEEEATVTVALTNAAPAGLPPYVTARPDDPRSPVGQAKYWVSVYLGQDGTLLDASLDGRPLALSTGTDEGLAVFSTFLTIDRGATRTLRLHVRQPARPGQPMTYRQQPLLRADTLVVRRQGAPLVELYRP
jgi:hypothetical protein